MPRLFTMLSVLCILCAHAAATAVPAEGDGLTLEDIFEMETVSDPQISPDGEHVVYVRHYRDVCEQSGGSLPRTDTPTRATNATVQVPWTGATISLGARSHPEPFPRRTAFVASS